MEQQSIKILTTFQTLPAFMQVLVLCVIFTLFLMAIIFRDHLFFGYRIDLKSLVGVFSGKNNWSDIIEKNDSGSDDFLRSMMAEKKTVIIWNTDTVTIVNETIARKNLFYEIQNHRLKQQQLILNIVALRRANAKFWDVLIEVVEDVINNNNLNLLIICPHSSVSTEDMDTFYSRISDRIKNTQSSSVIIKRDERFGDVRN